MTKLVGIAGFEPAHEGVKVPCLTAWRYPNIEEKVRGRNIILTSNRFV